MKIAVVLSLCLLSSVFAQANRIQTESYVNLSEFAGTWYRIASNPIIFEPSCRCARQILTPESDGRVGVLNTCIRTSGSKDHVEISGYAEPIDDSGAKLEVDFGLPWKGSYWIISFDNSQGVAAVTDSRGYSLYIMSRVPFMTQEIYNRTLDKVRKANVRTDKLTAQSHEGCW